MYLFGINGLTNLLSHYCDFYGLMVKMTSSLLHLFPKAIN